MAKYGGFGGGMGNMQQLMKQAQKMQKQMVEMQESLNEKTLEMTSGGGAVKIVISGKKEIQSIIHDSRIHFKDIFTIICMSK